MDSQLLNSLLAILSSQFAWPWVIWAVCGVVLIWCRHERAHKDTDRDNPSAHEHEGRQVETPKH
jgi:hypothetical protein